MYLNIENMVSLRTLTFMAIICSCIQLSANQQQCEKGDMFMSDPEDCSKYFLCKDQLKYHLECGNDLKFDPKTGKCSSINDKQCENGQTKYFPFQGNKTDESPKVSCYISGWTSCDHKIDELICDSSCYSNNEIDVDVKSSDAKIQESCKLTPLKRTFINVCYYQSYAYHYKGQAKYFPSDLDPTLCSHILYYRAIIHNETLTVYAWNSWVDFDNGGYQTILSMKAKGPKVMLVIGGWSESKDDKFSRIVGSVTNRKKVIDNILAYLEKWGFDGVEIDWQFPKCWQTVCSRGYASDSSNFLIFLKQLNKALKQKHLLLSVIASHSPYILDVSYDIAAVSEHVDWITVQSILYHSLRGGITGHVAPLYSEDNLNANYTIHYILAKGVNPRKIVMGVPALANNLELIDAMDTGYKSLVEKSGPRGGFLNYTDFLGFSEVCYYIRMEKGWTVVKDPEGKTGPYAYKGNHWFSYDDIADIKRKCDYIKNMKLGGASVWAMAYDDVRNRCGCGKYPIVSTVAHELLDRPKTNNLENCT